MRLALLAALCFLSAAAVAADSVAIRVTAISGTREGADPKVYDRGLEEVRGALADLPYDTFRRIFTKDVNAAYDEESGIKIDDRYTLYLKPEAKDDRNRTRIQIRIEERLPDDPGKRVNAVKTTIMAAPGHKIKFHGLDLEDHKGKLVVVLELND